MAKKTFSLRRAYLALGLGTLATAAGCISFERPFLTSGESTLASGTEGSLMEVSGLAGSSATPSAEWMPIGSFTQVVVDAVCYGNVPGRIDGVGSDYFVGSVLTTAAGDSDDPEALRRATEQEYAQGILAASDRSVGMPATVVRLEVGGNRCVDQHGLRSIPVPVQGDQARHRPRVTFSATYLRALRHHDIEQRIRWAIQLGERLLSFVGVDISGLLDRVNDQRQYIDLVRSLGNLQAAADVVMLGRFEVPLFPSGQPGAQVVGIPTREQTFLLLLSPDADVERVRTLVTAGRLRYFGAQVVAADTSLGCDTGAPTCPFRSYVRWHVEHAADGAALAMPVWNEINDAAEATRARRWGAVRVALGALRELQGSGILRDHLNPEQRRWVSGVTTTLGDAVTALDPQPGQLTVDPCSALGQLQQLGGAGPVLAGALGGGNAAELDANLVAVAQQLDAACAEDVPVCDGLNRIFNADTLQCDPRAGCPAGATRVGSSCECLPGTTWNSIGQTCDAPLDCDPGYVNVDGACTPITQAPVAALPTDAPPAPPAPAPPARTDTVPTNCAGPHAFECNRLGRWYTVGYGGLPRDDARAYDLFHRACDGGSLAACNNMAFLVVHGRGTPADAHFGEQLYHASCNAGDQFACANYATRIRASHPEQALTHYQQACDAGVPDGCRGLAYFWYRGCEPGGDNAGNASCTALPQDQRIDIAYRLELSACEMGDGLACREAAVILHEHPALEGSSARTVGVGLLYQGCALESPQACVDYAQVLRASGRADVAERLVTWSCGQVEGRPSSCR